MTEQEIEDQFEEEFQKLKGAVSKFDEAEKAYQSSLELFNKTTKLNSDLSKLKDELNLNVQKQGLNLEKNFMNWEINYSKKMDYLNEEIIKIKMSKFKDEGLPSSEIQNCNTLTIS